MIGDYIQPKEIQVDDSLFLVKYYPNYKKTLPWYQDAEVCRQLDNMDGVYDLEKLIRMYRYLSRNGECYYLKLRENGRYRLVGDISLFDGEIAIVISKEYQNRHLGRRAVAALLERAREIGWSEVKVRIYHFNEQSRKMFLSLGFEQIEPETYRYCIKKNA